MPDVYFDQNNVNVRAIFIKSSSITTKVPTFELDDTPRTFISSYADRKFLTFEDDENYVNN